VVLLSSFAALTAIWAMLPTADGWRRTERLAHIAGDVASTATWESFQMTLVCIQQNITLVECR
jgi:hypothetical protein